ncbi:MAG: hypothetical protein WAZ19_05040, partial [Anaerolineae bacterium]
ARALRGQETTPQISRLTDILMVAVIMQLLAGFANVFLLAPVWMQIIHLLLAYIVWITLVLLSASVAAVPVPRFATTVQRA